MINIKPTYLEPMMVHYDFLDVNVPIALKKHVDSSIELGLSPIGMEYMFTPVNNKPAVRAVMNMSINFQTKLATVYFVVYYQGNVLKYRDNIMIPQKKSFELNKDYGLYLNFDLQEDKRILRGSDLDSVMDGEL
ncbi:MAG: hypothetical protein AB7E96_11395 [Deferribacterales bacterium]